MKLDMESRLYYYLMSTIGVTVGAILSCWAFFFTDAGAMFPLGLKLFMSALCYGAGLLWIHHNRPRKWR